MMDEQLNDLESDVSLTRALEICRHFNPHMHWERLFAMNRRRHQAGGAIFVPYRISADGIHYRLGDVLTFVSTRLPNTSPEQAKEILEYHEGPEGTELMNLLHHLDGGEPTSNTSSEGAAQFVDDDGTFDGCLLRETDFYDALGTIGEIEDGIKQTMDHLVVLTKLSENMAAVRAKPDEPTAEHLSSFGWAAINDADKLLFKLQNLANILDRNCAQYGEAAFESTCSTPAEENHGC